MVFRALGVTELDASQLAVLRLANADSADDSAAVLGAPGTGKTTTLVELVADRILARGYSPESVLALSPTRASATRLRDAIASRIAIPTTGPLARTPTSFAFGVVRQAATLAGVAPPTLLTGGDQDAIIRQLLDGHVEDGSGPDWPQLLSEEVRGLRAFRTELRELMMRSVEFGISPPKLSALGEVHGHPEWVAAASFMREYSAVVASSRAEQLDPSELLAFAASAIRRGHAAAELRLVLVDDLQEATESLLALLRALAARGVAIVAFGDPDVAANAFRGGEPDALGRFASVLDLPTVRTLYLSTTYRQSSVLRGLTAAITARIGTAAAGAQRLADAVGNGVERPIISIQAPTPARQHAAVARLLRERHLFDGVPWNQCAVIVRSGASIAPIARALAVAEVPTRTAVGGRALRDDRSARALLAVVDLGMGRTELTAEAATELLLGAYGGFDRVTLRRLRLALRAEELAGGGNRTSDALLVDALGAPGRFATIDSRLGRNAARLAETLSTVREQAAAGATIEELLWLVWDRSGLAPLWRDQALSAGILASEANRNLDGVLALFTAAKRFVERRPGDDATLFLDLLLDSEVPEDTLSPQPHDQAVLVTTPSGAVGTEFDTVVIADLQEGVWPNLRLRGSLLNPQGVVDAVTGMADARLDGRRQVQYDELRVFALAVSRARSRVILSAVSNDDAAPSVFFGLLGDSATVDPATATPLSLRALTGRLRRELVVSRSAGERGAAASALARLAVDGIPGASPESWHGLMPISTDEPVFADDEKVPVSPSKLGAFEDSPLGWFIDSISGTQSSTAMGVGTIVHWAMETSTDPSVDGLLAAIESRWGELTFEAPWLAEQQRRVARRLASGLAEYLGDFERDGKALVAAEGRFTLQVDRAQVNGSIDRVERSPDASVQIVDLKTGRPITNQAQIDTDPQLAAYQLAYASGVIDGLDAQSSAGGAKLLYVREGVRGKLYREGIQPTYDEQQLEAFRERIRQAAIGMAMAEFEGVLEIDDRRGGGFRYRIHTVAAVSSD